jgi:hypothetical protein
LAFLLIVALVSDTVPRFHLGDSESYLSARLGGYLPDDRSWAYGVLASWVTRASRDLDTMVLGQIIFTWAAAVALAHSIARFFRLRATAVVVIATVLVCNPLSFYWARAYMTDTLAAAIFGLAVAVILSPRGILATASCMFVLAVAICALRSVYLPPMLLAFAGVAVLSMLRAFRAGRAQQSGAAPHWRDTRRYASLCAAIMLAGSFYANVNAHVLGRSDASVNHASIRLLVSSWSPLMEPGLAALGIAGLTKDRVLPMTYDNRLAHAFASNGVVELLSAEFGSYERAQTAYTELLKSASVARPLDFALLVAHSWSDYISPQRVLLYHRERRLTGTTSYQQPNTLSAEFIAMLQSWGIWQQISPQLPQVPSLGLSYLVRAGGVWALLLSVYATLAIVLLPLVPRCRRSNEMLALQLFAFAYMAMIAVTANELVTRYLIPLDIPLLLTLGAFLGGREGVSAEDQPSRSNSAALTAK